MAPRHTAHAHMQWVSAAPAVGRQGAADQRTAAHITRWPERSRLPIEGGVVLPLRRRWAPNCRVGTLMECSKVLRGEEPSALAPPSSRAVSVTVPDRRATRLPRVHSIREGGGRFGNLEGRTLLPFYADFTRRATFTVLTPKLAVSFYHFYPHLVHSLILRFGPCGAGAKIRTALCSVAALLALRRAQAEGVVL